MMSGRQRSGSMRFRCPGSRTTSATCTRVMWTSSATSAPRGDVVAVSAASWPERAAVWFAGEAGRQAYWPMNQGWRVPRTVALWYWVMRRPSPSKQVGRSPGRVVVGATLGYEGMPGPRSRSPSSAACPRRLLQASPP